jgi:hypothetical protein
MRARDIVGKKVASVRFDRFVVRPGETPSCAFDAIVFDDGTIFYVTCNEADDCEPWAKGFVVKPTKTTGEK